MRWDLGEQQVGRVGLREACDVWDRLATENPSVPSLQRRLIDACLGILEQGRELGREREESRWLRRAQAALERLPDRTAADLYKLACVRALCAAPPGTGSVPDVDPAERRRLADLAVDALAQAIDTGFRDLALLRREADLDSLRGRDDFRRLVARVEMAEATERSRDESAGTAERLRLAQEAAELNRRLAEGEPGSRMLRGDLAAAQHSVGLIHLGLGQLAEAREALDEARTLREGLLVEDSGNARRRVELASTRMALARVGVKLGQAAQARADLAAAAALDADDSQWPTQALEVYADLGLHDEAIAELDKALRWLDPVRHWASPRSGLLLDLAAHEATYARLLELRPQDDHLRVVRGRYLAVRGAWHRAAEDYRRVIRSSPIDSEEAVEYAAILLLDGDTAGYRTLVRDLIARVGASTDPVALQILARICGMAPNPGVGPDRLVGWAERALEAEALPWYAHALGLALYRAGRYDEAIALLERWNGSGWQPIGYLQNDAVLAMAHHRKGRTAKARDLLGRVEAWCRRAKGDPDLKEVHDKAVDWLHLQVLHREAEALIVYDPIFPANRFAI
jgi:tetratricopeptide (TPR) repeat protein